MQNGMILWTIQTIEAFAVFQHRGLLRGDWRRVDRDFKEAYRWMAEQMRCRGMTRKRCCPLWAWYVWGGSKRRRPDLRSDGHLPKGIQGVRIELEIDPKRVLLSDFDRWHFVLNNSYLWRDEAEADKVDRAVQSGRISKAAIRRSWEWIFDLYAGDAAWWGSVHERWIQGTMCEIRWEDVRAATSFTAR